MLGKKQSLLEHFARQHPDSIMPSEAIGLLSSVDDCCKLIFKFASLESEIEEQIRSATPLIAQRILLNPGLPFEDEVNILSILDHLSEALLGWTPDLGPAGKKIERKLKETLEQLFTEKPNYAEIHSALTSFINNESKRTSRLESRLVASETGLLRSQQARIDATALINRTMAAMQLSQALVEFLQGYWFESLQLLALSNDPNLWTRAEKLTETLIQTYQPIDAASDQDGSQSQHLYRIIENLPGEIKPLLLALEHDQEARDNALHTIEEDHIAIISGAFEAAEFKLLPEPLSTIQGSTVSSVLMRKVDQLEAGQWFTVEENDATVRVKLVLKLDDVEQLVFTNRNGIKVLQKNFAEFAYYLSSHIVRPLQQQAVFSSTFRTFYQGIVDEHERHQVLIAERRDQINALENARNPIPEKTIEEAAIETNRALLEAGLTEAVEFAARPENADLVDEYKREVSRLNTGAIVKLPTLSGDVEPCKLAVKISAIDKLIFVNRNGLKVGEYSSMELTSLLVAEQAAISDLGIEFEDTLAQVVTKLRQDRSKSYDDLTGK